MMADGIEIRKKRPIVSFGWAEGRYLDAWSLVHLSFGGVLALAFSFTPLSVVWAFVFAAALMIFWELFEMYMRVGESIENVFSDIVVGILGYVLALEFLPSVGDGRAGALAVLLASVLVLDILGWRAFLRRTGESPRRSIAEKKKLLKRKM